MAIDHDILRLGFMPELLPDELLYSFLARTVALNALGKSKQCIESLFGSSNVILSRDLPTRLQYLHTRLGSYSPVASPHELSEIGTLYPYHRPFLSVERDTAVNKLLFYGNGKGLKALLGRLANGFGAGIDLRMCDSCAREDVSAYGTTYWRRSHQLPGVTVCQRHATVLITQRPSNKTDQKQRFLLPNWDGNLLSSADIATRHQIAFSLISAEVLHASLPVLGQRRCGLAYIRAISQLGLYDKGRVQYSGFAKLVRQHYEDFADFPHRTRLLSTQKTPLAWIRTIIERPNRACHPICHLVLVNFLFKSFKDFLKALESINVEETPTTVHRVQANVQADLEHEAIYKDISLSCRAVARMIGISVTSVVSRRRSLGVVVAKRRKYIDEDQITKAIILLKERRPIAEVALLCNISESTVYRIRRENAEVFNSLLSVAAEHERDRRRRDWMSAAEPYFYAGITVARSHAPAAYAWLHRHDREWLTKSYAHLPRRRQSLVRVDWAERDRELCTLMRTRASEMQLGSVRYRVSRSLLMRMIGEASFRKNEHRLPNVKKLIENLVESPFSYELRRLDMAVHELHLAGKQLSMWRVRRAAGIRNWTDTHSVYLNWKTKTVPGS
ncbi:TnsD family Tn7-like transposition protein [Massilia timonae]|uniref:TnsD family Tn7-like transposition protein n=1 Tax=Massilia timonae TaxID=47229 RepID=UPI00289C371D|nr:TnsD family Tn7-like transposition protein [Massilia timonae]